ncbi:MAG: hypothetical protein KDA41_11955, partial [Planctomycetales bacterium]|nr:hypothetical protein [Planctomycetales bacterium]
MSNETIAHAPEAKPQPSPWLRWWPAVVLAAAGTFACWWFVEPACPTSLEIATGSEHGAYFAFAQQYREILARSGVDLRIRTTAGSGENAALLRDDASGVSLALLQSGAVEKTDGQTLESLASLYREPVWIFHRQELGAVDELSALSGKRVAVGA